VTGIALARRREPAQWFDGWPSLAAASALALALVLLAVCLGWRGSDLPAQVFRSELVRRDGFVIWNSQWFGGHALLSYSVLSPLLGALTGSVALGAVSCVAAAMLFERILRFAYGRAAWVGAIWFAVGSVTNLIVGRITFALGVALGLAAIYALQRRHLVPAVIAALLCSLSSPLAGAFLLLGATAWACAQRERRTIAICVGIAAFAPLAMITLLFPYDGHEPYEPWALGWDLALCLALFLAARRTRGLQIAAVLYAAAAVGSFILPTALGGNVSRLGQYVAGPLLACALLPRRRLLLAAIAVPLLVWQWYPTLDAIAYAPTDPSTKAAYYTPVVDYLDAQAGPVGRVEIPSTYRHWEAAYAAPSLLLARGWERQLDIAYNSLFYDKDALTPQSYHDWLAANGVKFVALPDARLDDSSVGERALLLGGLPYLQPVWHQTHWRVWRVTDFQGLVDGSATLVRLSPDRFILEVTAPGDVVVRVRESRHWAVDGSGCAASTDGGWTELRGLRTGIIDVSQSLRGTPCPG
jgi:hypothetical protein